MIENITTDGSEIVITLQHKYPVSKFITKFRAECSSEFYALLTAENLKDNLESTIQKIRQLEYEAGWSDAKKKKAKRTYFYCTMSTKGY